MTIDEKTVEERNTKPVKRVKWAGPVSVIIGLTGGLIFYTALKESAKERSPTKVEMVYSPTKAEVKFASNIFTPEQVRGYTSNYVVCSMDFDGWNEAKGGTDRETFVLGCNYFRKVWDNKNSEPLPEFEAKNADSKSSAVLYCFRPEPSRKFLLPYCIGSNEFSEGSRSQAMSAVPTQEFKYKGRNALARAKQDFDQSGIEGIILHGGWVPDTGRNYPITEGISPFTLGRITENELGDIAKHFKNQVVGALREFQTCREDLRQDNYF